MKRHRTSAICPCGTVKLDIEAPAIVLATCHCDSCKTAARKMAGLPGAPPIVDETGGSPFAAFRNDRVRLASGGQHLAQFRLDPASPTRRVVATCCNAPMFLDYERGFWLTLFRDRVTPALTGKAHSVGVPFVLRLIASFLRGGFKTPKLQGELVDLKTLEFPSEPEPVV